MTFKTQLATDMANVFLNNNEFSETVTYTTLEGVATAGIEAVIADLADLQGMGYHSAKMATVVISVSDIAAPKQKDTITTAAGLVWIIDRVENSDDGAHTLSCSADYRQTPGNLQGA